MERLIYPGGGNRIVQVGSLLVLVLLVACDAVWNAPEGHARDFIQTLVMTPAAIQQLRTLANITVDRNPEDLLDGLSARVAVDFLRAKEAQGVTLDFGHGEVQRTAATQQVVGVRVAYVPAESGANSEIRFQVDMEKDDQGRWRIARVTGGN